MELRDAYFAQGENPARERQRLLALAGFYAEWTQDWLIRRGGPLAGLRILEAGAGSGAMLDWLAGQAGLGGDVLRIDVDTRHTGTVRPPARLVQADLYAPAAEPGRFDLVYARLVLEHLPDPDGAINALATWLRPGGLMMIAALDFADVRAADRAHPDASAFDEAVAELHAAIKRTGLVDPGFGRTLANRFRSAGLNRITEDRFDRIIPCGSPWAVFMARNSRMIGAKTGAGGAAETAARLMEREGLSFHDQTLHGVTGRIAVSAGWD
jgi:SAM-dependent methyltransferase